MNIVSIKRNINIAIGLIEDTRTTATAHAVGLLEGVLKDININEELTCPFCGWVDFDRIGLKLHLQNGHCDKYNEIDTQVSHTTEKQNDA